MLKITIFLINCKSVTKAAIKFEKDKVNVKKNKLKVLGARTDYKQPEKGNKQSIHKNRISVETAYVRPGLKMQLKQYLGQLSIEFYGTWRFILVGKVNIRIRLRLITIGINPKDS